MRLKLEFLTTTVLFLALGATPTPAFQKEGVKSSPTSEARLIREIRHELVTLPFYGIFDNLAFRVDGGTVTLLGQVTRPTLKDDAERVVKNIEGVERVRNEIEVLPPSPD